RRKVDVAAARVGNAPSNERPHRPHLEKRDAEQQHHLEPEGDAAQIIGRSLFQPAECAPDAAADPEDSRNAPERIANEGRLQAPGIRVDPPKRERADSDPRRADDEGEKVNGGNGPGKGHVTSILRLSVRVAHWVPESL